MRVVPLPMSPSTRAYSPGQVPAERSRPEPLPPTGAGRRTTDGPQQSQWPPPGRPGAEPQAGLGQGPTSAFRKADFHITVPWGQPDVPLVQMLLRATF